METGFYLEIIFGMDTWPVSIHKTVFRADPSILLFRIFRKGPEIPNREESA